jgi:hypothetical protein
MDLKPDCARLENWSMANIKEDCNGVRKSAAVFVFSATLTNESATALFVSASRSLAADTLSNCVGKRLSVGNAPNSAIGAVLVIVSAPVPPPPGGLPPGVVGVKVVRPKDACASFTFFFMPSIAGVR